MAYFRYACVDCGMNGLAPLLSPPCLLITFYLFPLQTLDLDTAALSIGENDSTEMPWLVESITNSLIYLEELALSDSASDTDHDEDDGDDGEDRDDGLEKFTSSQQNAEPSAHLEVSPLGKRNVQFILHLNTDFALIFCSAWIVLVPR